MATRLVLTVVSLTLLILQATSPVFALTSLQRQAYNAGLVYFDTEESTSSGCTTLLTGDTNGIKAFNFFVSKKLSAAGAAGIVGNMTSESTGVDPERLQGHFTGEQPAESSEVQALVNDTSTGWGIVQWTPPSKVITTSHDKGIDYTTIDTLSFQLDFLWNELQSGYKTVVDRLQTETDPRVAAEIFETGFEHPKYPEQTLPPRQAYAEAYFQLATNNTPLPPNVPVSRNDGGGGAQSAGGGDGCSSTSGYQNPMRDVKDASTGKTVPMRIDQGVDYGGSGPVYALGKGTVMYASDNTGWPGKNKGPGTFISYKLSEGSAAGHWVFIAENCNNIQVSVGDEVDSNTVLCTEENAYPYIETGWAVEQPYDLAAAHTVYGNAPDGTATAYGQNFSDLLKSLGAPAGTYQYPDQQGGRNLAGSLPSGWPTW